MKTLSIAMATYNGAQFIGEQLESFARQTMPPLELVVTDDGSTDGTPEIVAAFAARAPFPVRFEKNEKQLGYRANFMKAAALCKGELIAFCDQDDVWLPEKLEKCVTAFSGDDVLFVYHNATVVTGDLKPVDTIASRGAPRAVNPPLSIGPWSFGPGFTQVFRSDLRVFDDLWPESVDFHDATLIEAHDTWYFFLASCLGTIVYIKEPLVLYRRHDSNTTKWAVSSAFGKALLNLTYTSIGAIKSVERAVAARLRILEKISARTQGERQQRVHRAINAYRPLERRFRERRELYTSDGFFARMLKIIALVREGTYGRTSLGGTGYKAFIRDFYIVFFTAKRE